MDASSKVEEGRKLVSFPRNLGVVFGGQIFPTVECIYRLVTHVVRGF